MRTNQEKRQRKVTTLYITTILILLLLSFFIYKQIENNNKQEAILNSFIAFQKEHPDIEFPKEFDLKEGKTWDSGVSEYTLKSSKKNYIVYIKNNEVIELFIKKPKSQLYPLAPEEEVAVNTILPQPQSEVKIPEVKEALDLPPAEVEPMGKIEYTFVISKLLGEALINIDDIQLMVEKPTMDINADTIDSAKNLLNESINLYTEAKAIVPPIEWQQLHQDLLEKWEIYIIGEEGLVNSIEEVWTASEDERKKAFEVLKEKGQVTGEYSLALGDLILRFLGEIIGVSN